MSLTGLVTDVADLLQALSPAPALVGAAVPTRAADLPAVVLEVDDVEEPVRGLGRLPAPAESGALAVIDDIDLAHPQVVFSDGVADLLSGDRRTLFVPHGPIVRADGVPEPPFGATDFAVSVAGTNRPVVDVPPTGNRVQLVADLAELRFANPLPAAGDVHLAYHVGLWEVRTSRHRGRLDVTVYATDVADVEALSTQVEQVLTRPGSPLLQALPLRLGPVQPAAAPLSAVLRTAAFRVDYERVDPLLSGAGGVITEIDLPAQPLLEAFVVRRRSPT